MAQLAIQGHATRGREVIELLEMLGGKNKISSDGLKWFKGTNIDSYYTIEEDNHIHFCLDSRKYIKFTIEGFLKLFPYKVGDQVIAYAEGCLAQFTIQGMRWNYKLNRVEYKICSSWIDTGLIMKLWKEESMEKKEEISLANIYRYIRLIGYDFYDDKGNIIDAKEIILKKKQPQCPKTYEECCRIVNANPRIRLTYDLSDGQKYYYDADNLQVYESIRKLLVCRDAYWNIAGVEMGLGEPWEPDWEKVDEKKYCIVNIEGNIAKWVQKTINKILAFPTEEMRDDFYENFKGEIEQCKELL